MSVQAQVRAISSVVCSAPEALHKVRTRPSAVLSSAQRLFVPAPCPSFISSPFPPWFSTLHEMWTPARPTLTPGPPCRGRTPLPSFFLAPSLPLSIISFPVPETRGWCRVEVGAGGTVLRASVERKAAKFALEFQFNHSPDRRSLGDAEVNMRCLCRRPKAAGQYHMYIISLSTRLRRWATGGRRTSGRWAAASWRWGPSSRH